MEISAVGDELFHVDGQKDRQKKGQTDEHDEANSRFSQFCQRH